MLHSLILREVFIANKLLYLELELPLEVKIECIKGHNRLSAAENVLQGIKKR
ncbi:hypothetical protein V8C35DRAFT_319050 [Trichoderma chlorosporum]